MHMHVGSHMAGRGDDAGRWCDGQCRIGSVDDAQLYLSYVEFGAAHGINPICPIGQKDVVYVTGRPGQVYIGDLAPFNHAVLARHAIAGQIIFKIRVGSAIFAAKCQTHGVAARQGYLGHLRQGYGVYPGTGGGNDHVLQNRRRSFR